VKGRKCRIHKQLLDDLKNIKVYWKFKEEELHRFLWSTSFGRFYWPIVRQITGWMSDRINQWVFLYIGMEYLYWWSPHLPDFDPKHRRNLLYKNQNENYYNYRKEKMAILKTFCMKFIRMMLISGRSCNMDIRIHISIVIFKISTNRAAVTSEPERPTSTNRAAVTSQPERPTSTNRAAVTSQPERPTKLCSNFGTDKKFFSSLIRLDTPNCGPTGLLVYGKARLFAWA
jgi:hypothetical protein